MSSEFTKNYIRKIKWKKLSIADPNLDMRDLQPIDQFAPGVKESFSAMTPPIQ